MIVGRIENVGESLVLFRYLRNWEDRLRVSGGWGSGRVNWN